MKKKFIYVLIIFTLFSAFANMRVFADEQPKISVSSAKGAIGETFDITIALANNPGIISMLLNVDYDSTALTLVNVKDAEVLGSQLHSNDLKLNPYVLYWSNGTAESDFTVNGTIATLTFEIMENAQAKDYPITVSYDKDNDGIFNYDFNAVDFNVNNGKVTVSKLDHNSVNNESIKDENADKTKPEATDNQKNEKYDVIDKEPDTISVKINDKYVTFTDQLPVIQNDRTLVPLRNIFEALGATVDWNDDTKTVTSVKEDKTISLAIGSNKLYVNNVEKIIDVPAQIINNRTMVPTRAIVESFDCKVDCRNSTKTVIITN